MSTDAVYAFSLSCLFFFSSSFRFIDDRDSAEAEKLSAARELNTPINRPCKPHQNSHLAAETCLASRSACMSEVRAVFLFAYHHVTCHRKENKVKRIPPVSLAKLFGLTIG